MKLLFAPVWRAAMALSARQARSQTDHSFAASLVSAHRHFLSNFESYFLFLHWDGGDCGGKMLARNGMGPFQLPALAEVRRRHTVKSEQIRFQGHARTPILLVVGE